MFSPLIWILVLIGSGFAIKLRPLKKLCFGLGLMVFLIFSSPALFQAFARWWQPEPVHQLTDKPYSFGVVAGGFGSVDSEGNGYFNSASDRFLQAVKLYKTGVIEKILISGGNSRDKDKEFAEAAWARQEMISFGIPDSSILVEDKSANTAENAVNSEKMLDSLGAHQPYVLITSAFHMPRAQKVYERAGMQVVPYPCNYTEGRGPIAASDFIPSLSTLTAWPKYLKEAAWMLLKG